MTGISLASDSYHPYWTEIHHPIKCALQGYEDLRSVLIFGPKKSDQKPQSHQYTTPKEEEYNIHNRFCFLANP